MQLVACCGVAGRCAWHCAWRGFVTEMSRAVSGLSTPEIDNQQVAHSVAYLPGVAELNAVSVHGMTAENKRENEESQREVHGCYLSMTNNTTTFLGAPHISRG